MAALRITGKFRNDNRAASKRIRDYRDIFVAATGIDNLHEGTLNIWFDDDCVSILPEFMIEGKHLDENDEDYLFEKCKLIIDGKEYVGVRYRPYNRTNRGGGNGDKCVEVITETIEGVLDGMSVTLEFDRDSRLRKLADRGAELLRARGLVE